MEMKPTQRGFLHGPFVDSYGSVCSIQQSSNASEPHIWLGVDRAFNGQDGTRMHLTRPMVAQLLPLLQHFVATGDLPHEAEAAPPATLNTAALLVENRQLRDTLIAISEALDELNSTSRT